MRWLASSSVTVRAAPPLCGPYLGALIEARAPAMGAGTDGGGNSVLFLRRPLPAVTQQPPTVRSAGLVRSLI